MNMIGCGAKAYSNGGLRSNSPGSERCEHELVVRECSFSNNTVANGWGPGSAIQSYNGHITLEDDIFTSNTGAAVYIESSDDGSGDRTDYISVSQSPHRILPHAAGITYCTTLGVWLR